MEAMHPIEVGAVKRQLPVREVKPGVFVALFNPLGGTPPPAPRPPGRSCVCACTTLQVCAKRVREGAVPVGARSACAASLSSAHATARTRFGISSCVCFQACVCARVRGADHELNEALGEVLTPKIPEGTQVPMPRPKPRNAQPATVNPTPCARAAFHILSPSTSSLNQVLLMPDGKAQALLHVLGMRHVCVWVPVRVCACMRLYVS